MRAEALSRLSSSRGVATNVGWAGTAKRRRANRERVPEHLRSTFGFAVSVQYFTDTRIRQNSKYCTYNSYVYSNTSNPHVRNATQQRQSQIQNQPRLVLYNDDPVTHKHNDQRGRRVHQNLPRGVTHSFNPIRYNTEMTISTRSKSPESLLVACKRSMLSALRTHIALLISLSLKARIQQPHPFPM